MQKHSKHINMGLESGKDRVCLWNSEKFGGFRKALALERRVQSDEHFELHTAANGESYKSWSSTGNVDPIDHMPAEGISSHIFR